MSTTAPSHDCRFLPSASGRHAAAPASAEALAKPESPAIARIIQRTPYEQHRAYVLGVLGRRCRWLDASDREATLHDAYVVLLEKQRSGELDPARMHEEQVRAYLTQTALHKALDERKRAWRRLTVPLDGERLREIVAGLPERQQLVVKLRYFLERTPQEIQRDLGVSERVYRRAL